MSAPPSGTPPLTTAQVASHCAEHPLLASLPLPACVLRGERLVSVNAPLVELLGEPPEALRALEVRDLLARFAPAQQAWLEPLGPALQEREGSLWLRLKVASGAERTLHARFGAGPGPGERLLVLHDAEGEGAVRSLTEALAAAAGQLLRCRDEASVLETAVEAVHRQGFYVTVLLLDGEHLLHGPMRQDAASVAAAERLYGRPLGEVRFPRASVPHLEEVLARRKAFFHQDGLVVARRFHVPAVAELIGSTYPAQRMLDAPLFVGEEPLGFLSVQGAALTPASAGTLELFARLVGGALENVRHHRAAQARLAELSRLQGELVAQERLSVLGEAAGVVAHEVRNPLGAIFNAVAVLKREGRLGPAGSYATRMLEEEASRLEDMVRDLLDVVRPFEPRPRPLHLGELARRVLELVRPQAESREVRFELDEPPELPLLSADEELLQLALSNLLRNALHASPQGGRVRVALALAGAGGLSLVVEDEGPGISAGVDARRAFEPFFTVRASGAGLGLAVVRRVALAHGGAVHASNRPGQGARFELVLPSGP